MNQIQASELDRSTCLFKAFADPVRLRLLHLLAGGDEICVCHLHEALELPQPTVSRHLAYLRKAGLVLTRKEGLWVYYRLARPASSLHRTLADCIRSCLGEISLLRRDAERLRRVAASCRGGG